MRHARILALSLLLSFSPAVLAREGSANVSSACATLGFMGKMLALNTMLPADFDDVGEMSVMGDELAELNQLACQPVILTGYRRGNSYYTNGTLISNDLYHQAWYFPNGQLFMAEPGLDTALFWPNRSLATNYFRAFDETWYYPDGNIITYEAGYSGGRWFYPFQRLDGGIGQEIISSNWGVEGEDFTFLNFTASGSLFTASERIRRKLIFDDIDLLDVPGVLLLITRLYQASDSAKQFAPADVNITGAPF
jgi:hypothetical protein